MFSAKLEVEGSATEIEAYFAALQPEEGFKTPRAGYKLRKDKNKLVIEISAEDATAFRAVTNTLLGLMQIVEKSLKAIK